jgi:hypothetical protein
MQRLADRLRAGRQEKHPPEQLGDLFDAPRGLLFLELDDFVPNRLGDLCSGLCAKLVLQSLLALEPVAGHPLVDGGSADTHFLADHLLSETFLQMQFDCAEAVLE